MRRIAAAPAGLGFGIGFDDFVLVGGEDVGVGEGADEAAVAAMDGVIREERGLVFARHDEDSD